MIKTLFDSINDIEDITWLRGDMKFIFECSNLYLTSEHEKINFISPSNHVIFCLLYRPTNYDVFGDFPKIFKMLSEGRTNVSQYFPKISEDLRS